MNLAHATLIIIGAPSGIGRETAHLLASAGRTCCAGGRQRRAIARAGRRTRSTGKRNTAVAADIAPDAAASMIVEAVLERWGRMDVLINNAGIGIQANVALLQ